MVLSPRPLVIGVEVDTSGDADAAAGPDIDVTGVLQAVRRLISFEQVHLASVFAFVYASQPPGWTAFEDILGEALTDGPPAAGHGAASGDDAGPVLQVLSELLLLEPDAIRAAVTHLRNAQPPDWASLDDILYEVLVNIDEADDLEITPGIFDEHDLGLEQAPRSDT